MDNEVVTVREFLLFLIVFETSHWQDHYLVPSESEVGSRVTDTHSPIIEVTLLLLPTERSKGSRTLNPVKKMVLSHHLSILEKKDPIL